MTNASSRSRTALVLGASRGIGLETVRQYLADGWRVIATVRTQDAAQALQALGAETHVLDLTDANAIAGLIWKLDGEALDVAIYVAGIYGPRTQRAEPVSRADFDAVMQTNGARDERAADSAADGRGRPQRRGRAGRRAGRRLQPHGQHRRHGKQRRLAVSRQQGGGQCGAARCPSMRATPSA